MIHYILCLLRISMKQTLHRGWCNLKRKFVIFCPVANLMHHPLFITLKLMEIYYSVKFTLLIPQTMLAPQFCLNANHLWLTSNINLYLELKEGAWCSHLSVSNIIPTYHVFFSATFWFSSSHAELTDHYKEANSKLNFSHV